MSSTTETDDVLSALEQHRGFLRRTLHGLSDEQAALTPTASELCLGGLIKHVAVTETQWARFLTVGASALGPAVDTESIDWSDPPPEVRAAMAEHQASFSMVAEDTVGSVLGRYVEVARTTEEIVRGLPSLDISQRLPDAPWFEPGASWSARRVLLHLLAETSQHAGHADIIRETIDGQKTMG